MKIYLVQHGIALDKSEDARRPLSELGRSEVNRVASHLKRNSVSISEICHSGKLRAQETSAIFSDAVGSKVIKAIDGMDPNDDVVAFAVRMRGDDVMYVGHLPHMQKLTSWLVTGDENAGVLKFHNGCVVCLEKVNSRFQILWSVTPDITLRG
ncbi:MAG: phosphohistidine phosphatase SixA [Gammaproteobacteria bacterium]|nr:phosphohistidine phosphatase SixA [Gammaproteobacteria bacterium]